MVLLGMDFLSEAFWRMERLLPSCIWVDEVDACERIDKVAMCL